MGVLVGGERGMGGDESEECGPELSDTEGEGTSGTWVEQLWHGLITQETQQG